MSDMTRLLFMDVVEQIAGERHIWINKGRSTEGHPYWTVAGGDVQAGGYRTLDDALSAWLEARTVSNTEREP